MAVCLLWLAAHESLDRLSTFDNTSSEQLREGTRRGSRAFVTEENTEEYAADGDSEDVDDQESLF